MQEDGDDDVYVPPVASRAPSAATVTRRDKGNPHKREQPQRPARHIDAFAGLAPTTPRSAPPMLDLFDTQGEDDILSLFRLDDSVSSAIQAAAKGRSSD